MISDSTKFAEETVRVEPSVVPLESGAAVGFEQPLRIKDPASTEAAARSGSLLLLVIVRLNSLSVIRPKILLLTPPQERSHLTIVAYIAGPKQYFII